jgi:hypothetical protein
MAGGDVVTGVAWVVTGAGPEGDPVQPAIRTASRTTAPMMAYQVLEIRMLMKIPHELSLLKRYIIDLFCRVQDPEKG